MYDSLEITVSIEALFILYLLQKNGYEAYIVGGAVRDTLLDGAANNNGNKASSLTASDYDFATNAKPEEIQNIFPNHFYENKFGTVGVAREHLLELIYGSNNNKKTIKTNQTKNKVIDINTATKIHESLIQNHSPEESSLPPKDIYEITTYRSDEVYTDFRRPIKISWGKTIQEDISRRDFTINAMAIKVNENILNNINFISEKETIQLKNSDYQVIDLHGGVKDLESGIIRTVGNPNKRFNEDALRMLRAIRFSVQLNMKIESDTFDAIITNSHLLQHISFERIRDEFLKMLKSDFSKQAIEILDETGLLKIILPELIDGKGVSQGGHHTTDVWTHNLDAIDSCPSKDPIVRLATLLHDIAKPHTYKEIDGKPTFYNHEIVGSRMAKNIAKRLRLSKKDIDRIFILVRYHMFYYQPNHTDASIRRFMRNVGLENINDILDLREADRLGSGAKKTSWRLEEMKQRMIDQLHQPFAITDLAVNGNDLMEVLDIKPGPKLGELLQKLFEQVLENPELNTKDHLLDAAKKLLA